VIRSRARISSAEGISDHLLSTTDLWTDDYDGFFFDGLGKNKEQ
jgi:hypothetical protein